MKKLHLFIILLITFYTSQIFSQTLFTQDFESESVGTISSSTAAYPYYINYVGHANCESGTDWQIVSSHSGLYGTEPAGMSGKRAAIRYGSGDSDCVQYQSLNTEPWQTTHDGSMKVEFSYSYFDGTAGGYSAQDEIWIYLLKWDGSNYQLENMLVNLENSGGSADFSTTVTVNAGEWYRLRYYYYGTYDYGAAIDNIQISHTGISIADDSAITGLDYDEGSGASSSSSITVVGSDLSADITVSAPTGFEVSTDDSTFSDSLTLSHSGGSVSSTTVYVRLKSGLSDTSYSGNVTFSSSGQTSRNVSVSGEVSIVYYVDDTGSDSNNGLSDSSPFATLSQAISTAVSGTRATISVAAGTYTEHSVNVNKSNLTIKGAGSSSTIFDSNTGNKGFMSITASNVTVEKIKIKDYNFTSASTTSNGYGGGAIRVGAVPGTATIDTSISGITITDVYFEDNSTNATSGDGGAIEVIMQSGSNTTTLTVNGCTFEGNRAGTSGSYVDYMGGAAIMVKTGGIITVNNSLFFDNITDYRGAITLWTSSQGTINNSTF